MKAKGHSWPHSAFFSREFGQRNQVLSSFKLGILLGRSDARAERQRHLLVIVLLSREHFILNMSQIFYLITFIPSAPQICSSFQIPYLG